MYAEVEPPARLEQILHLLVGFGLAEFLAEMKQYLFRHSEAGPSGYLAPYELGYERFCAVAGAAHFHYILAVIVSLREKG